MLRPRTDTIKFLTGDETGRLFQHIGTNRRDRAIFLVAYRHGLLLVPRAHPLIWEHVNPYGRFELDINTRLDLN